MRIRIPLIVEDTVMQKIDEIAGEKHRRAAIVDAALREYIERHEAKPKPKVEVADDPKSKAKAAAVERKSKPKTGSRATV